MNKCSLFCPVETLRTMYKNEQVFFLVPQPPRVGVSEQVSYLTVEISCVGNAKGRIEVMCTVEQ